MESENRILYDFALEKVQRVGFALLLALGNSPCHQTLFTTTRKGLRFPYMNIILFLFLLNLR
jgi:hypothetical protein